MTSVELMDNLTEFIREIVKDYSSQQKGGDVPVAVYSGWPPIRMASAEKESFIYALALEWEDKADNTFSTCKVEIGFSIYDDDKERGCFSLYNIMEHVRQSMLKHRTINCRNRLELPVKSVVSDDQFYPQWLGAITATYTIGQPEQEEIDYGDKVYAGEAVGNC